MRPHGLARYFRQFEHRGGIIVCEERKFIYMKAPRTGGTSILRKVLEPAIPGIVHHKDTPASFAGWQQQLTDARLEEYFIFSFVRNPWDRFVSMAFYFKLPVASLLQDFDRHRQRESIRLHSLPLYQYTHCAGTPFVDFVGRFETLQSDFEQVCERIGLHPRKLPLASRTVHEHYSRYYDPPMRDTVASLYAQDIKTFHYTFESR